MSAAPPLPPVDPDRLAEVCRRLGVRILVLYGSRATGTPVPRPESDLDLAVRLQPGRESPDLWELQEALSEAFPGASLDVAFLRGADPLFRWEVMREGRLLWGDPLDHLEYRAFAYRDFVDSADLRELERTLFKKKMAFIREALRAAP